MPDPLLYLRATGVAAAITLTMAILLRRWPRGSTSGRRVLLLLGAAGAVVAGWAVLGIRPAWPPRNGLDRLLTILLPATLAVDLAGKGRWIRGWGLWAGRMVVSASAGGILLYGSVYLRGDSGEWSWLEVGGALTALTLVLAGGWYVGPRLLRVANESLVLGAWSAAWLTAGLLIMLAGYLKGGAAAFPFVGAMAGLAVGRCHTSRGEGAASLLGMQVVGLAGLLFVGRYFGGLSTPTALIVALAPWLGWFAERPWRSRAEGSRRNWRSVVGHAVLVSIPLLIVLVRGKAEFDRKLRPLLPGVMRGPVSQGDIS